MIPLASLPSDQKTECSLMKSERELKQSLRCILRGMNIPPSRSIQSYLVYIELYDRHCVDEICETKLIYLRQTDFISYY